MTDVDIKKMHNIVSEEENKFHTLLLRTRKALRAYIDKKKIEKISIVVAVRTPKLLENMLFEGGVAPDT